MFDEIKKMMGEMIKSIGGEDFNKLCKDSTGYEVDKLLELDSEKFAECAKKLDKALEEEKEKTNNIKEEDLTETGVKFTCVGYTDKNGKPLAKVECSGKIFDVSTLIGNSLVEYINHRFDGCPIEVKKEFVNLLCDTIKDNL